MALSDLKYRKVKNTNTSRLQIAYEWEIGYLCTVTFWGKVDFLISNTR